MDTQTFWKKCSSCKRPISFRAKYWVCNVSTCNRARTGLVFCQVSCWDAHVPILNHRESWSEERMSPSKEAAQENPMAQGQAVSSAQNPENEVLVVVSKLKGYIKAKADMNTSGDVMDALSDHLRNICDDAILRARNDGRKTVMARDFQV